MAFSKFGRLVTALVATAALGLGMTACGGGTIGYLWVASTYKNQINGFKIDDYTGNLTPMLDQPYADGGTNPQTIIVKSGGRFVYVINSGTGEVGTPNSPGYVPPKGAGIVEYSVGGGGVLTEENTFASQGFHPVWASTDTSGNYLYLVDKYSPAYCATATCTSSTTGATIPQDLNGSITAFAMASDTGRLTLVTNAAILQPGTNIPTTYFEVGPNPTMVQSGSTGCLFTLSPTEVYPYSVNSSNGQLTVVQTGPYVVTPPAGGVTPNLTSINLSNSSFTYLTDSANNYIYALSASTATACSFSPINAGSSVNVTGASDPVNSVTSSTAKFLYVINGNTNSLTTTNQVSNSSISAFNIDSSGRLSVLSDTNNPYAVGSGPVCLAIDPTKQYMYISDNIAGTVTGKVLDQNRGFLSDLSRGSVFTVSQNPTCLAISGNL